MATLTGWKTEEEKVSEQGESHPLSEVRQPQHSSPTENKLPVSHSAEMPPVAVRNQPKDNVQIEHQSGSGVDDSKTKRNARVQCVIICSILLIAVAAVVVAVIMTTKLRSESGSEKMSRRKQVLFICEAAFMEKWMPEFQNPNSLEYISKMLSIEEKIDRAFRTSEIRMIFNRTHVFRLRSGSVMADFTVMIDKSDDDNPLDNGTVFVSVDDSGSKVDAVKVIENTIKGDVTLNVDAKRVKVKVAVSWRETTTLPNPGQATTSQASQPSVSPDASTSEFSCPPSTFQCETGACIPQHWVCNGRVECQDGSDETLDTCTTTSTLTTGPGEETSTTTATSPDEAYSSVSAKTTAMNVTNSTALPSLNITTCDSDEFLCGDKETCRSRSALCNGFPDCVDASDERGCVKANGTKIKVFVEGESRYLCGNGENYDADSEVGRAVCHYLGREGMKSISTDEHLVLNGTVITPYTGAAVHFLGNFQSSFLSECRPLLVECSEQATACGRSVIPLASNYIQLGKSALPGQWPWAVQLRRGRATVCGGTVISRQWVLTAGHCIRGYAISRFSVVLRSYQRSEYRVTSGREYRIIKAVTHENYSRVNDRSVNDLALLLLNETLTSTDFVQPVCLPSGKLTNHDLCYVVGWGKLLNRTNPKVLQQTRVKTYSGQACNTLLSGVKVLDSMICASGYRRNPVFSSYPPTCYGDSGGPMVCLNRAGGWDLQGVMSMGPQQCVRFPGTGYTVLSNVYSFKPWIQQKIKDCVLDCEDGTCIYVHTQLCDGQKQCADGRDEIDPCADSVTCDFELVNMCGYRNISESVRKWSPVTRIERRQNIVPYITDHTMANPHGTFMALRTGTAWMDTPAILESPELPDISASSCLTFYFFLSYISPTSPHERDQRQPPSLKVLAVFWSGQTRELWSVGAKFNPKWHRATITLPPRTRRVRFQGLGYGALDDVIHNPGQVCNETVCEDDTEVKCPSTKLCVSKELFCDGEKQCEDEDLDESPEHCGAGVNCSFSDSYICGYSVESSDKMAWEWREQFMNLLMDVTYKDSIDSHSIARYFTKAMAIAYTSAHLPRDRNATMLRSSLTVPEFNLTSKSCLEFVFLIYNFVRLSDMPENIISARLSVLDVTSNNTGSESELWSRVNSQGQEWRLGQVILDKGHHHIRFQAEVNSKELRLNIGLDDVKLIPGGCQFSVISCDGTEFRCSDEQCIPTEYFCDGKQHCANGADEYDGCSPFSKPQLVGGAPYANQGRVEVYARGQWQPVCASGWDSVAASAACFSLGYSNGTKVDDWQGSNGSVQPVLQLDCTDPGSPLEKCRVRGNGKNPRCDPSNGMAFVSCGQNVRYENVVRLRSSNGAVWEGLVEIHHNDSWGAVCNSHWDETAANITCRMLGYSGAVRSSGLKDLPRLNSTRPWLIGLHCHGNESFLHECQHGAWDAADCTPAEYVSLECINDREPVRNFPKDLRLAGGSLSYGRVEILYGGEWGTMCDDRVTQDDVVRICREFGYGNGTMSGGLPTATGPIWIDNLSCSEDDVSILDCRYSLDDHDCTHHEDVVVSCFTECRSREFLCHDNKTCVEPVYLCDGESDCPGLEDEANCDINCTSDQFKCQVKQCVAMSERCDGHYQCRDGSDEAGCVQISGDGAVHLFAFGEWRPLCASSDDVTELATIVCSVHSLSDVLNVSSYLIRDLAWSASSANGSLLSENTTGIGGLRVESPSACPALYVSCGHSECGENFQPHKQLVEYFGKTRLSRPGKWPWHVRIAESGTLFGNAVDGDSRVCEGVLLSPDWALTGEECLGNQGLLSSSTLEVSGGGWVNGIPSWSSLVTQRNLSSLVPPKHKTKFYDMALLKLEHPVAKDNNSAPVCLPGDFSHGATKCYLTGGSKGRGVLEMAVAINVSSEICDVIVGNPPFRKPKCMRYLTKDVSCKTGSKLANPILCQHPSGHWAIEGFSFAGTFCLSDERIDLYASVRDLKQWLIETMSE